MPGSTASPAPLLAGAELLPGGSVRALLPAGTGVAFPVAIVRAGRYRLDVVGLGRSFTARLDDAEGWPVATRGAADALDLQPGRYRLLVSPEAVEARVVARLTEVPAPADDHRPRAACAAIRHHRARDLAGAARPDTPRTPDAWRFALAGPANVTIAIGDGMVAELLARGRAPADAAAARPLARITARYTGKLPAGRYRLDGDQPRPQRPAGLHAAAGQHRTAAGPAPRGRHCPPMWPSRSRRRGWSA